jgi:hypothetical protein
MVNVLVSILLGGGFGGVLVYLSGLSESARPRVLPLARSIAFGVGAALVVPLFLKLAQSELLQDAASAGGLSLDAFYLCAFCLLAATQAQDFIQRVRRAALGEESEARRLAARTHAEMEQVKSALVMTAEVEGEIVPASATQDLRLTPAESSLLLEMQSAKSKFHTVKALSVSLGRGQREVTSALEALRQLALIERVETAQLTAWFLTPFGQAYTPTRPVRSIA